MSDAAATLTLKFRTLFDLTNAKGVRKIVVDLGSLFAQRGLQRLSGFVSLYFLARHLSLDDFGQYQFAAVAMAALAFMALTGLDNALMQAVARGEAAPYRRATRIAFGFSLLGALMLAGAALWGVRYRPDIVTPTLVAAIFFPAYSGLGQWKSILLGEGRFKLWSVLEVSTTVATHACLITAVFLGVQEVGILSALFFAPSALMNACMTYATFRRLPEAAADDDRSRTLFRYGIYTSAVTVVSVVAEQIERAVIFFVLGPATLAIYFAGDRLAELIRSIAQDAAAVLAPRFAKMSSYSGRIAKVLYWICTIAGAAIIAFAFTLAPTVLLWMFGESYRPSIPFAQGLLFAVAIGNVGQFQFRFIRSQVDKHAFRDVIIWTSGLRILAAVALIPRFGAWGAVAGVIAYRLAMSVASSMLIRRKYSGRQDAA